jgi:DNA-binding NarL/FixJ family response regulator
VLDKKHKMGCRKNDRECLSPREVEVISLLANGMRTGQISQHLGIRCVTVDLHIRNARKKLNAATREQAVAIAVANNIIATMKMKM